jgi:hypothetical protein
MRVEKKQDVLKKANNMSDNSENESSALEVVVEDGTTPAGPPRKVRVVGKAVGDECEGPGWQMRSGSTPYRTRRAVRAVTGPLKRMT